MEDKKKVNFKIVIPIVFIAIVIIIVIGTITFKIKNKPQEEIKANNIQNIGESLVNIEKIYYSKNKNGDSYSLYLTYSIKSDNDKDITTAGETTLISGEKEQGSSYYNYDMNKDVISMAGYPTAISYTTLYAQSDKQLKYIAHFTVGKKDIEENNNLTFKVKYNGYLNSTSPVTQYEYLEKKFKINDVSNFLYIDNNDFIKEFKKDHNIE